MPAAQIVEHLTRLAEIDRLNQPLDNRWFGIAVAATIGSGIALFVSIPTQGQALVVAIPLIISSVIAWIVRSRYAAWNFPDRRYDIPRKTLEYLAVDMDPHSPAVIRIDFNDYHQACYQTDKQKDSFFSSVTKSAYTLPWFSLQTKMLDGSKIRLNIGYDIKRKDKQKRKRTKVTLTFREEYDLQILVDSARYPTLDQFSQHLQELPPPRALRITSAAVVDSRIRVQATTESTYSVTGTLNENITEHHSVLQLFLACYESLYRCRAGSTGK